MDQAIATLDDWAAIIAQHAVTDPAPARVNLEIRQALESVQAIAESSVPPTLAPSFRLSSLTLLSVVRPLLRSPADQRACDQLRSVIEGSA